MKPESHTGRKSTHTHREMHMKHARMIKSNTGNQTNIYMEVCIFGTELEETYIQGSIKPYMKASMLPYLNKDISILS